MKNLPVFILLMLSWVCKAQDEVFTTVEAVKQNPLQVKVINWNDQKLEVLPDILFACKNLEILEIRDNQLTEIPSRIELLTKLKFLYADHNKIKSIPQSLYAIDSLKQANLSYNQIEAISPDIKRLGKLKYLNISHNKIKNLPAELTFLQNLKELNISDNNLVEFPKIEKLSALEILDLTNNKLQSLPVGLETLPIKNLSLKFDGSNFINPIPDHIIAYLENDAIKKSSYLLQKIEAQKLNKWYWTIGIASALVAIISITTIVFIVYKLNKNREILQLIAEERARLTPILEKFKVEEGVNKDELFKRFVNELKEKDERYYALAVRYESLEKAFREEKIQSNNYLKEAITYSQRLNAMNDLEKEKKDTTGERLEELQTELATTKLALKRVENMNNALSSALNHDAKTDLNEITALSNRKKRVDNMNETYEKLLAHIYKKAMRMKERIDGFLMVQFKGNGFADVMHLKINEFSLHKIAQDAIEEVQENEGEKVVVENKIPQNVGVWVIETLIASVFRNLLNNAYTALDGIANPRITISCESEEYEYIVKVQDNARGIDNPETYFQDFSKIQYDLIKGGASLGGPICKAFVEMHGGQIRITETSRQGTIIKFSIPKKTNLTI